jgi:wobble nucleotide-excising tRNase
VKRDEKKAHHLSEGEVSLIAFCYFIAKLKDINTKGKKPIIWIDDPISSLDSNHIFFIYTLINTQIYGNEEFEQLFISTHNLNFLKYIKRLPNAHNDNNRKENNKLYRHLIIERKDKESSILNMPNHIKKHVTEFNYLFNHIYKCSIMENVTDENYTSFYNFGNNARKFLELFLFYKYPDETNDSDKMKKFFGGNNIPVVLTDRINNEYSHLCGSFERGESLIEVPEMNTAAKLIIERIKHHDNDQYEALLKSVDIPILKIK